MTERFDCWPWRCTCGKCVVLTLPELEERLRVILGDGTQEDLDAVIERQVNDRAIRLRPHT